ncbi:methyltransferase domain-containing protein [Agrococcus carbonis]|uniref:Methyltransferase domain-containing protein n=1 Tax=Agrococcus carbonis TaxID=684552 RepID=A0A1H1T5I8_9MICO|nr:methyltransferase domain-containing protein [Agrococcus carbonis]SDS55522.1 Methyltransferase domain-containing protein [Agrococcus carbonis]
MTAATYTHGHHASVVAAHAARTVANSAAYLSPLVEPGMRILDVGCGPGSITIDLARRVGDAGLVVGIDASAEVVETARAAAAEAGIVNAVFEVGDAYDPTPAERYDIVHAHQVLQHLGDPVAALRAWRAVGEVVAARDVVYSATTIHPLTPELARWRDLVGRLQSANGGDGDAGAKLKAWARAAGFTSIETDVETWCFETQRGRDFWGGQWVERALHSAFADGTERLGLADAAERQAISDAWAAWQRDEDGWMAMLHGWILARE